MKIKSIFKLQRCIKCDNLILKSESKHVCKEKPTLRFPHSRRLDLEIWGAFNELNQFPQTSSEICHYINKQNENQNLTHFEIEYHIKKMPESYAVDTTKKYKNKYAEKYYFRINNEKSIQIQKQLTTTKYHIQSPRTQWGLTHSIKKTTFLGNAKKETTLAMVCGKELAETLLQKCKEAQA